MALPVKLNDIVSVMDLPANDWAYINGKTGKTVWFSQNVMDFDDTDTLEDWEEDMLIDAREVAASDDFVQLPDKHDIHDYAIMERFCHTVEDDTFRENLLDAIRGRGAFGRFARMIARRGLEQSWYAYRNATYDRIAADFLETQGIAFERT